MVTRRKLTEKEKKSGATCKECDGKGVLPIISVEPTATYPDGEPVLRYGIACPGCPNGRLLNQQRQYPSCDMLPHYMEFMREAGSHGKYHHYIEAKYEAMARRKRDECRPERVVSATVSPEKAAANEARKKEILATAFVDVKKGRMRRLLNGRKKGDKDQGGPGGTRQYRVQSEEVRPGNPLPMLDVRGGEPDFREPVQDFPNGKTEVRGVRGGRAREEEPDQDQDYDRGEEAPRRPSRWA